MSCPIPPVGAPVCPIANVPTVPVGRVTVSRHALLPELPETTFGFCDLPACDVVYVGADGTLVDKAHLRTRVGIKETADPIPVCYCFDFSARQIADDLLAHGRSTIRAYIREQVRVGRCRCELTNPAGRCCLGDVGRVLAATAGEGSSR